MGILSGVLTVATIFTVALGIVDQGEANVQAVTGAICIYVLIGLLFVFLYGVLAVLGSGNFFAQGTDGTRSLRLYFSFVTLATLGYGDYTPAGELGRTLRDRRGALRPAVPRDGDRRARLPDAPEGELERARRGLVRLLQVRRVLERLLELAVRIGRHRASRRPS